MSVHVLLLLRRRDGDLPLSVQKNKQVSVQKNKQVRSAYNNRFTGIHRSGRAAPESLKGRGAPLQKSWKKNQKKEAGSIDILPAL